MATSFAGAFGRGLSVHLGLVCILAAISAQGQTQITSCGTHITAPGRYVVAADLNCPHEGIEISGTHDVELRLGGHQITTPDDIAIAIRDSSNILVQGPGTLRNNLVGVSSTSSQNVRVIAATAINATIGFQMVLTSGELHADTASRGLYGFELFSFGGVEMSGNTANDNEVGFHIDPASMGNMIHDNTALNNRKDGIFAYGGSEGNLIEANTALGNGPGRNGHCCDLEEANQTCGNLWQNNIFLTANLECIH